MAIHFWWVLQKLFSDYNSQTWALLFPQLIVSQKLHFSYFSLVSLILSCLKPRVGAEGRTKIPSSEESLFPFFFLQVPKFRNWLKHLKHNIFYPGRSRQIPAGLTALLFGWILQYRFRPLNIKESAAAKNTAQFQFTFAVHLFIALKETSCFLFSVEVYYTVGKISKGRAGLSCGASHKGHTVTLEQSIFFKC